MPRTKTASRKNKSDVPDEATTTTTRRTGPNRPKQAMVLIDSHFFKAAKPVVQPDFKPSLCVQPGTRLHLSRFFPRPEPPPLTQEEQDLDHMRQARRLARIHLGEDETACNTALEDIRSKPGFAVFFNKMFGWSEALRLPQIRPLLIQECHSDNPFLMIVAVILLNKTRGTCAVPMYYQVIERWNTPVAFSQAKREELFNLIECLGFGEKRTDVLIKLGQMWLQYPPVTAQMLRDDPVNARIQRATNAVVARKKPMFRKLDDQEMPPIAHLPWVGAYAMDSYRIYCCDGNEWKSVRPKDKELRRYIKWRWAMLGRAYDVNKGVDGNATPTYIRTLIDELAEFSPYKTLDRWSAEIRAEQAASGQIA